MKCPRCGAEVMLGSAQCDRCGTSLFGDTPVTPVPAPSPADAESGLGTPGPTRPLPPMPPPPPVESLASFPPPPPPAVEDGALYVPPPAPPAGWTLGSTINIGPPPPMPPGVGTFTSPGAGKAIKRAGGIGCFIVVLVMVGISVGAFFLIRTVNEAVGPVRVDVGPQLALGERASGSVADNHVVDHSFVGTGEIVQINVDGFGDLDAVLEVFDGQRSLGRDDDTNGRDPELEVAFDEGETYRIRVSPFSRSNGGRYTIEVTALGPAPIAVPSEQQGSPTIDGGRLTREAPLAASLGAGQVVRFTFVGAGSEHVFEVSGVADFDPTLTVRDESGTQIGFDDDSLGDRGSQLALTIPEGQVVTLEVAAFGNDEAGSFTIRAR